MSDLKSQPKFDRTASTVIIRPDGIVTVDGIPAFRRIVRPDGIVVFQFCDDDKLRSSYRGSRLVEIPVNAFLDALE